MKSEELEMDLPGGEDENVGDIPQKKKREKKRKSKEERAAERKVIFWTLLIVMIITFLFWFVPRVGGMNFSLPMINVGLPEKETPKQEMKNYVEYKL